MENDPWIYEKTAAHDGFALIAGVDEAGRGPLAGPVVSAAVILPHQDAVPGIRDSKTLSAGKRARLYDEIHQKALAVGVGVVHAADIDRMNILQAALHSMMIAVKKLSPQPQYLLIDGKFEIKTSVPQQAVVKGDARSLSIGAASIVAKVTRDRMMENYDHDYPQFGFARHKGYPTRMHREAIRRFGPCPLHRCTFKGVREYVCRS